MSAAASSSPPLPPPSQSTASVGVVESRFFPGYSFHRDGSIFEHGTRSIVRHEKLEDADDAIVLLSASNADFVTRSERYFLVDVLYHVFCDQSFRPRAASDLAEPDVVDLGGMLHTRHLLPRSARDAMTPEELQAKTDELLRRQVKPSKTPEEEEEERQKKEAALRQRREKRKRAREEAKAAEAAAAAAASEEVEAPRSKKAKAAIDAAGGSRDDVIVRVRFEAQHVVEAMFPRLDDCYSRHSERELFDAVRACIDKPLCQVRGSAWFTLSGFVQHNLLRC